VQRVRYVLHGEKRVCMPWAHMGSSPLWDGF
jgi:hypothetical protein